MNKCLYCYGTLDQDNDFHEKCSLAFFESRIPPSIPYTFGQMAELAKQVVERSISVPGVQPKLSMSLVNDAKQQTDNRLTVVGALGGNYIFKPPSEDYPEMPANEHVTMRIAEAFGINVVPSSLIRLQSGELSYITKRVDRKSSGEKIHMLDMFQILEAFDKYKGSMERIGKALGSYSVNPLLDKLFLFELTLFSFLTGNDDMHLKNFSMIQSQSGWMLAPAYDLLNVTIILPDDPDELALTIEGKKRKFTKSHFERFGLGMGLTDKQIHGVFKRMQKNKAKVHQWLEQSFLSAEMRMAYQSVFEERISRLTN